jgi:sortase A
LLLAGVYTLILAFAPAISTPFDPPEDQVAQEVTRKPEIKENKLYIPSINVGIAIIGGESPDALEHGAWHRKPENGDPVKGGNFVLSAHRFSLGMTPGATRVKSPFYHIDKIKAKDQIYVDYEGKRYAYEVTKLYKVDKTAVEIEQTSQEPKLTLYSCDLRGENAGREVVEAKPVGIVEWDEKGTANIVALDDEEKVAGASIVR